VIDSESEGESGDSAVADVGIEPFLSVTGYSKRSV
jgi:hypothetical protein